MLFFGDDLVIVVGAVFSLVDCMFPFRVRMEFFTKKRKKKIQCCLWVSSDALSHLKINSEVRNASLLPFSALFCLCSVHDILHWVSCTCHMAMDMSGGFMGGNSVLTYQFHA